MFDWHGFWEILFVVAVALVLSTFDWNAGFPGVLHQADYWLRGAAAVLAIVCGFTGLAGMRLLPALF